MEDELYTNGDEELDRYYSASLIRKANFPVDKMDKSTLVRQYDEESKSDKLFMPLDTGGYTSIGNAPPEMIQIPASGKQMALSIPKNRRGNGLQGYFDDLDSAVKKVTGPIITGAAQGVDRFTDTVSDFLGKYMKFKIDPVNLLGIPEINPKQIIMDATGFDGIDVSMFEPDTKPGMMAKELISYVVGYSLTPGGPLGTSAKVFMKDAGAMMSEGPYIGNIFEIAKDLGLENEITSYLSASIENPNDATLDERLASRIKATTDIPLMAGVLYSAVKILGNKAFQLAAGGLMGTALTSQEAEGSPLGTFVRQTLKSMNRVDNLSQPGKVNQVDNTVYQRNDKGDLVPKTKIDPEDNIARIEVPTDNEPGIIAFHGSGADFDEFKLDKIGSGEGAQMYGYGLYFTEVEDIAKYYKNTLSTFTLSVKGKEHNLDPKFLKKPQLAKALGFENYKVNKDGNLDEILIAVGDAIQNNQSPLQALEQRYKKIEASKALQSYGVTDAEQLRRNKLEAKFAEEDYIETKNILKELDLKVDNAASGKTYKVALSPKPEELLDYDLPFSEQSDYVKKKLRNYKDVTLGDDPVKKLDELLQSGADVPGSEIVKVLKDMDGNGQRGAQFLNELGIKGIKYRASGFRNPTMDTEITKDNFVIFDDAAVNILAKYGIVGPVAVTVLSKPEPTKNEQ